ncbi:hypothetical protein F4679DRAFT_562359 [Xylaria curta]|nr:hypothetical protein F4679DRAFT_562359 [Xylaria curta]
MGFLSRLTQLCLRSGVRACSNNNCVKFAAAIRDGQAPCNWMPFREWAITAIGSLPGDRRHNHRRKSQAGYL